ncbi:MAG: hypothetical protein EU541_00445 [Promethearchaeota archaeon]|nr:MAG: hypothetical protein EU541_00445 [Candidatus Lokiarchaeota archaeon]
MLKTFIYNKEKDKWIEETEILLFHDILAIFDEKSNKIFLWKGPEIKESILIQGKERLKELISTYSEDEWIINEKKETFPNEVHKLLNEMLKPTKERKKEDILKFNHFFTIRLCFLILIGIVIFLVLSLISILIPLFSPRLWGSYIITATFYDYWIISYQSFVIISLILCIINILLGIYERDLDLIIFSLMGIIISIGIILYLQKGIFLFLHQPGSTSSIYYISILEITVFSLLNLIALMIALIPHIYKLYSFGKVYWKFIYLSAEGGIESESR